jgi:pimeloyl-ACP methyl ester carboxylesterase
MKLTNEVQTPVKNIVLVHGAWADGSNWLKVIPKLEAKGFHVTAVQNPLTSLADDVATTRRAIALEEGPVLLVGHSYGGVVITEAGDDSKVSGLVYVAAFAPDLGESSLSLNRTVAPTPESFEMRTDPAGFVKITSKGIMEDYAQDLSEAELRNLVATQGPTSMNAIDAPVTTTSWKSKPCWYIVATDDRAILPELQVTMSKRIDAVTISIAASHAVMLSHPDEVANFIARAAAGENA